MVCCGKDKKEELLNLAVIHCLRINDLEDIESLLTLLSFKLVNRHGHNEMDRDSFHASIFPDALMAFIFGMSLMAGNAAVSIHLKGMFTIRSRELNLDLKLIVSIYQTKQKLHAVVDVERFDLLIDQIKR